MNLRPLHLALALTFLVASLDRVSAQSKSLPNFDVRSDGSETSRAAVAGLRTSRASGAKAAASLRTTMAAGQSSLAAAVPGVQVEINPVTKTPEVLDASLSGAALTAPSANKPEAVVRGFMSANAGLFGLSATQAAKLETVADYANPAGNLSWVELQQKINGIPVFQGTLRAAVRKDGAIARTTGNLAAGLDEASLPSAAKLSPSAAAVAAAKSIDVATTAGVLRRLSVTDEGRTSVLAGGPFRKDIKAELVYFPVEPGVATLAYSMVLWQKKVAWYVLVDAQRGQLLWRKNITNDQSQSVTYSVYDSDSPNPLSPTTALPGSGIQGPAVNRTTFTLVSELPAFDNLGWITDGGNITSGNNVDAGLDIDGSDGVDANGRATGSPNRVFNFAYIPGGQPGGQSPTVPAYRSGIVTNLFFWSNRYHDRLYSYGFTEAARNFQNNNFSRGGSGNDAVSAQAQDYGGTNNANFYTPPDGQPGEMQMYIFDQPNPQRDGDLDQEVVLHELTHGLSNRLHANGSGLTTLQAGGMGEGWSDFYARCLLSTSDEDVNGVYASGAYATRDFFGLGTNNSYYGIRRFPYAVKTNTGPNGKPHNPLTFGDVDPGQIFTGDGAFAKSPIFADAALEVHNIGEIWCSALLEVRARIITRFVAQLGTAAGFQAGNDRMLQITTDAMKLEVASPTILQARNSIVAADVAGFGSEDVADIWAGFAAVGMGFNATVTNTSQAPATVVESYITPNLVLGSVAFTDSGAGTNANGDGFADPGETIKVTIPVTNLPPNATATTVTVSLDGGTAVSYPDIPNSGGSSTQTKDFFYTVPPATPAGTLLKLTVAIDSSLGPVGPVVPIYSLYVGQPVNGLAENFDSLPGTALPTGWTTTRTGTGVNWAASTTNPDSGTKAVFTPDVGTASTAEMVTPAIAMTAPSSQLTFRNWYNLEYTPGTQPQFWDGMVLEMSVNGAAFQDIIVAGGKFLSGGYNATLEYTSNPLAQRNAWSGVSVVNPASTTPIYVTTTVQLPATVTGKSVRFKWIVGCDSSAIATGTTPGARIDGVAVSSGAKIGPVNHPPVINDQTFSVVEHQPGLVVGTVIASDQEATQTLTYAITAGDPNGDFSISNAAATRGQLTMVADLEHDTKAQYDLTVKVTDDSSTPASQSATITVKIRGTTPPVITGQNPVSMLEDATRAIVLGDLVVNDPDSIYPDDFTLTVLDGTSYTHSGNSITPSANFNGMLSVNVKVNDGAFDSTNAPPFVLLVSVTPVNDVPSFVKGQDIAIIADGQPFMQTGWATAISTGPLDEEIPNQTPNFTITTTDDGHFDVLPAVAADGTLTFTAKQEVFSVTVTVTMHDDGGMANNGVDTSASQSFVISSTAVANDPPTFIVGADQAAAQDAGAQTVTVFATAVSPGPPDEASQAPGMTFSVVADNPGLFDQQPAITLSGTLPNITGTLTYTPKSTASGSTTVHVILNDNATGAIGGAKSSPEQTFVIAITTFQGHFGDYNGLALPVLGTTLSVDKTGLLALKFTSKGSFTGKLKIAASSFSLKGVITNAGVVLFGKNADETMRLERKGLPVILLSLHLDVVGTSDQITGTLRGEVGPPTSTILADLAKVYPKGTPAPLKGKYTVIFDKPQAAGLLAAALPQGAGFGSLVVSEKGIAKLTGQLADGSKKFTYANVLSKTNFWPVWVPFAKGAGALAGRVQFRDVPAVSDLDGPGMFWFRPQDLKQGIYPNGWPKGATTNLVGSAYTPDADVARCFDSSLPAGTPHHADLLLSGGGLNTQTLGVTLDGKKVNSVADPKLIPKLKITFKTDTGLFQGTFLHQSSNYKKSAALLGAVLQKQKTGSGFFSGAGFISTTGAATIDP